MGNVQKYIVPRVCQDKKRTMQANSCSREEPNQGVVTQIEMNRHFRWWKTGQKSQYLIVGKNNNQLIWETTALKHHILHNNKYLIWWFFR